jgi:hypothetical protein
MDFSKFQQHGSPHHFLAQLAGSWKGKTRTWFDPDTLGDESPTQGSIQLILDGRFAIYLYQSSLEGEPLHGMFTFGYNTTLDQYEASWVDSFHNNTAIMFGTGQAIDNGFSILGSYPDPAGGPDWGWRTEVVLRDANHLVLTAYNISPEGGEAKAVETGLERIK